MTDFELNIPEPFLQKHLEKFQTALRGYQAEIDTPLAVYRGAVVRAAIDANWLDIEKEEVGEMLPAQVVKISEEIVTIVSEAQQIPKN